MTDGTRKPGPTPPQDPGAETLDWDAVGRYVTGESSDDEVRALRDALARNPGDAALVAALERATSRLAFRAPADLDVEGALRRVKGRLDEPDVRPLVRPTAGDPARPVPRWRAIGLPALAAAALVAAGVATWRAAQRDDVVEPPAANPRTFATAVSERDSLRLPDGTRVVLGPQSELIITAGYGGGRRDVALRGEAYFDVAHDDARPFVVRAGGAAIRDIGTAFTVRSVDADSVVVAVTSGAVLLRSATAPEESGVLLHAGDQGVLGTGGQPVALRGGVAERDTAWIHGRLVFRESSLDEVSAALRRWYGIELRVADASLASRHITASFAGEPASRVLEVIGLTLGADIERRGDTAFVRPATGGGRTR